MTAIPGDVLAFTLVRLAAACLVVFLGWPAYALPLPPGGDPGERRLVGALASLAYLALGVAVLSLLHLFGLLTLVLLLLLPLALRLPRSAQPYALSRSQSQLVWLLGFLELVPELPTRALAGVRRRVRAWAAHVLGRSPLTWSLWLLGLAALGALLALELPFPWSGQNALPQPVADLLSAVTHLLRGHPLHGGVGPLGYPALLEALITLTAANPLALVLLTGAIATLVTWFALWFVAVRLTGRLVPAFAAVAAYALLCLAFARLPVAIDASPFAPALAVWALYFTRMTLTRALPLDRWALALLLALAGLLGVGTFLAAAISSALTALTSALGGGIPRQVWGELPPLLLAALLAALAPLVLGVLLGGTLAPLTAPSVTLPPWGASALLVALWLTLIAVSPRPEGWLHADVAAVLAVVLAYVLVTVAVYFHRLPKLFLVPDVLPVLGSLAAALAVAALEEALTRSWAARGSALALALALAAAVLVLVRLTPPASPPSPPLALAVQEYIRLETSQTRFRWIAVDTLPPSLTADQGAMYSTYYWLSAVSTQRGRLFASGRPFFAGAVFLFVHHAGDPSEEPLVSRELKAWYRTYLARGGRGRTYFADPDLTVYELLPQGRG